ncbi:MAG TPA: histidine phosphatase family protein [Candidatus Saccharimonadales bacterium]|nr:histidine phosphatase family protein [Candidatus Saccharimonadales bacterium]
MIDPALQAKYPQEDIDKAIELLTYKNVDPLPKTEAANPPILYVFRHGQTEDNANFIFSGWRDSPLTEHGREQALELAPKLKDKKINLLIASPQIRAVETMKLAMSLNEMCKNMEIHKDPRIKERSYGVLQGKSKLEMQLENPELLKETRRSYTYKVDKGESLEMVVTRVFSFCDEIVPLMKAHKINVAVSCHGNSIRGFRKYFEHLSDDFTAEIETPLAQDYASYSIK